MLTDSLDPNSVAHIVLSRWLPGLITVLAGGYIASILFPKLQKKSQQITKSEEKKTELAEKIVQYFNRYVVSWRRLIQISWLEEEKSLSNDESERKMGFIAERNERRDHLLDQLKLCQLYFGSETCAGIQRFMDWDEQQSTKALSELPSIEEWRFHEEHVIGLLKNEIN